jgi:glycosyltransferase involved in cell wall biosynthesis
MHIIECHFEFTGFDDHLVKAGTSVYLWNLARQFRDRGHRVSAVTPAHGLLPLLRRTHDVTTVGWEIDDDVPVRLDPQVWPGFPAEITVPVRATAYRTTIDGIEITLLGGDLLDTYPDSLYPPRTLEGTDTAFLKPLVFQVAAARYLAGRDTADTIVHLHEPFYHYLLPAALTAHGYTVVSTVQTNLPVNTKVYAPEVRSVLRHLGADTTVADGLADPSLDSPLHQAMRSFLPQTLLHRDYPERPGHDYVSMLALVARSAAALDFLSEGQLEHALTQAETPYEQMFTSLAVARELRTHADRLVVGGCAIGDEWLDVVRSDERRDRTLTALGLDPALPTIYHNGRYSVEHKGLREMFKALRRLLEDGEQCNVLLHCLAPHQPRDADLDALERDFPKLTRIRTGPMTPAELTDWAASSDLCVFSAKFEMDTFLMAMGEAMASGAIPIATAQRGMRHFRHGFDLDDPDVTGLAVPRSFRVDDPLLTDAVHAGLRRMVALVRADAPEIGRLRERAITVARGFTWGHVAERFLAVFAACLAGTRPADATPPDHPRPLPGVADGDAGHGTAVDRGGAVEVRWDAEDAARVEIVRVGTPPLVQPLDPAGDGTFTGRVDPPYDEHLAVLVTRADGRARWADVPVTEA